jgi:4-alpha-glucanotransferase
MTKSNEALDRLADMAGLEQQYWDIYGTLHKASEDTKRTILSAMGIGAEDDAAAEASMRHMEEISWRRPLPPVLVVRTGERPQVLLSLAAQFATTELCCEVMEEDGTEHRFMFRAVDLPLAEVRDVEGDRIERRQLRLPFELPMGYHDLVLVNLDAPAMPLIVVPHSCFIPEPLIRGEKQWGISAHVYSMRSRRDWGIGDFTALRQLVDVASAANAAAIGVNPLHALFLDDSERASPYSPSSRLFLNTLYIDVEGVDDFARCAQARQLVEAHRNEIDRLRAEPLVDYARVATLKQAVLKEVFACYREQTPLGADGAFDDEEFRQFREVHGADRLRRFAVFEALSEHFGGTAWREWPEPFRDPHSLEVAEFAEANHERVAFSEYLQWQADRQLGEVHRRSGELGLTVGLYRDLAVGVDPAGADAWGEQDVVVTEVHVGAPPDPFNMLGQDWGLPPLNPVTLRDKAYEPFTAILRANMRHAGALRIDHVMALFHLYWIPAGAPAKDGVYLAYPFEDLLGILALESQRNRCMIIGEDLGTVPEGFRERMALANVLSYRVLYFEKDGERFKRPDEYPELALACVTTHDLATLAGFWKGSDIELRRDLKLYPSLAAEQNEWQGRARDRKVLLTALAEEKLLPDESDEEKATREISPELVAAVHRYLALSPAMLLMVQIDEITGEENQINLPGTVDEYPNWRRRVSLPVEDLASAPVTLALDQALRERRMPQKAPISSTG